MVEVSEMVNAVGIEKKLYRLFTVGVIFRKLNPRVVLWGLFRVSSFQIKTNFSMRRYNYGSLEDQTEFRMGGDICGKEKVYTFRSRMGKTFKVTFKLKS